MSRIRTALLHRTITIQAAIRNRLDQLEDEAGLEDSTWKAIWTVAGAAAALTITGLIVAWVTSYLGKLPG